MKRWSEMSPRERDALIAEKVMGRSKAELDWIKLPDDVSYGVPEYSTDIAAAWEVVKKLGTSDNIRIEQTSEFWRVYWDDKDGKVDAKTAPLAICLAALKTLDIKV